MANHEKTLEAIFRDPVPANIKWRDIESLLKWLGAEVTEGAGSRVLVVLNGYRSVFHRPHPRPEAKRGAVRSVRSFLLDAGVRP